MGFEWTCGCGAKIIVSYESPETMSSYSIGLCPKCYKKAREECVNNPSNKEYLDKQMEEYPQDNGDPMFTDMDGMYFLCKLKEDIKMNGLELYNKVRVVPAEAKKPIQAGRLKGMTDINPMWRLKVLTEQFGPCGLGWSYEIVKQWIEEGSENQKVAFTNINLYVKYGEEWSKAIPGTGGSSFIAKESKGPYTSDECFKMALTDAISVACKSLGIGADVYFDKDRTKYDGAGTEDKGQQQQPEKKGNLSEAQVKRAYAIGHQHGIDAESIKKRATKDYHVTDLSNLTKKQYDELIARLEKVPVPEVV